MHMKENKKADEIDGNMCIIDYKGRG